MDLILNLDSILNKVVIVTATSVVCGEVVYFNFFSKIYYKKNIHDLIRNKIINFLIKYLPPARHPLGGPLHEHHFEFESHQT
jgi:hypothetical protein